MTWQAVVAIVAVFGLAMLLGWFQHRAYRTTVDRVAAQEHRPGVALVSGRAKGVLRGAVAILVVDRGAQRVVRALVMEGASVFARFREAPELVGPVASAADRARSAARRKAVADALDRSRRLTGVVRAGRGR